MKMTQTKMNQKNNQAGFSAVEMLVAMFIFSIVGLAIVAFQIDIFSLNRLTNNNLIVQEDARRALRIMSAEIRSMSASNMGSYALEQTSTSTLIFYTNIDSDPEIEKVRYFLDGTTFKKGVIQPTGSPLNYNSGDEKIQIIARDIANNEEPIFSYYDTDYDGTTDPLVQPVDAVLVRLIKINIMIDQDITEPPASLTITTQVSIRNLKDNL